MATWAQRSLRARMILGIKSGMKIMSLADPTKKMSKSDENQNAVVYILDDRDTVIRKFRRAVTDSDNAVVYLYKGSAADNYTDYYFNKYVYLK